VRRLQEDNKLVVGIAYHDPYNMWPVLQKDLLAHLPLRNVTWRSPLSGSFITIDRLPVIFRKADSEHFKDTTHPFAWYRGAYEYIYILVCESMDAYKSDNRQVRDDLIITNVVASPHLAIYHFCAADSRLGREKRRNESRVDDIVSPK
jgi:hypothetical protein